MSADNNFLTVMSNYCNEVNNAWARVAELFSNPKLRVNNLPAGDANTAHCGRALQEHRAKIFAAMTGVPPPPPSGSTITSGLSTSKCLDVPNLTQLGAQVWGCYADKQQRCKSKDMQSWAELLSCDDVPSPIASHPTSARAEMSKRATMMLTVAQVYARTAPSVKRLATCTTIDLQPSSSSSAKALYTCSAKHLPPPLLPMLPLQPRAVQMTLYDCHGLQNQRFELLPDGSIRVPGTNRCLDVRSGGTGGCVQPAVTATIH